VVCDARQIGQALTNLLKNGVEAIEARLGEKLPPGRIELALLERDGHVIVQVADNGRGLPASGRERLTEPYVTTRTKGTGLGLAIVKKIMEDHGGQLQLADRPGGGAVVTLIFPKPAEQPTAAGDPEVAAAAKSFAHGA
jgi:two-component system nitrogen regulation sensor histidine kinase NtrY